MNTERIINHAFYSGVFASLGCGIGYLYGSLSHSNRMVSAKAFAISGIAAYILLLYQPSLTDANETDLKHYQAAYTVGCTCLGIIEIVAFKQLNLIATLGTIVFSVLLVVETINNLNKLAALEKR